MTKEDVLEALREVNDPELHRDLVSLGMIDKLEIAEGSISFTIVLTTPACPLKSVMERNARAALHRHFPALKSEAIQIRFGAQTRGDSRITGRLPIKNILAIASGKGGVGKSSVTVNLALALAQSGAKVGVFDADIYGPNINIMLGGDGAALPTVIGSRQNGQGEQAKETQIMTPAQLNGVYSMSIGYLVEKEQALAWRGPMLHGVLRQLFQDTQWPELDYLLIDMPPGTGDVQLSIPSLCPVTSAIIVSSPQKVALSDTRRGITAFQQLKVPILGLIENMAGDVFGWGGGEAAAKELNIPFLGRLELDAAIRRSGDSGHPLMLSEQESAAAMIFADLAGKIAARLAVRHVNFQGGAL